MMKNKIFICDCYSVDHQLVIGHIDGDDEDIYFNFHIDRNVTFWDKLINFLPFIFKWQKRVDDGHYLIFNRQTEGEIKRHLKKILESEDGTNV